MKQQKSFFIVGVLVIIVVLVFLFLRKDEVEPSNTTPQEALTLVPTVDAPIPTEETLNQIPQEPPPNL